MLSLKNSIRTVVAITVVMLLMLLVGILATYQSIAHAERTAVSSGSGVMTVNTCNTASSTLAFIQSPFPGATSTAIFIEVKGTNAASSTDLLIATSTTSAPAGLAVATSSLNQTVLGLFSIPANKQFFSIAGQTIGPGVGYNSAAGGTYRSNAYTVVGPNEGLLVFATSSSAAGNGGTAVGSLGVPANCTIEVNWLQ